MGQISGLVAIDADSMEAARELYRKLPRTAMITKTANGAHFLYRLTKGQIVPPRVKTQILGVPVDIRGEGSYVVAAPSIHPSGKRYQRVGRWELVSVPCFQMDWLTPCSSASTPRVKNVVRYIATIEAISGQGGHAATFRATCKLRDAGLTPEQALAELIEWNQTGNAQPPWSVRELLHKVESVFKRSPQC